MPYAGAGTLMGRVDETRNYSVSPQEHFLARN